MEEGGGWRDRDREGGDCYGGYICGVGVLAICMYVCTEYVGWE